MYKKNTAVTGFQIGHFINATTGAAVTTGTPTCKRTLDGTGGACANAAAYNTNGAAWGIDLAAGDMNGDVVGLSFTLTDCLPISYTIKTVTKLVSDLQDPTVATIQSGLATPTNITAAAGCVLANSASHGGAAAVITLATPIVANTTQIEGSDATDQIDARIAAGLNTAIPGSPTANSINERIKSIDDLTQASGGGDLAAMKTDVAAIHTHVDDIHDTDLPAVKTDTAAVKVVTDNVAGMYETDGAVKRFTVNSLENAPSGTGASAASIADAVWDEARADHTGSTTFGGGIVLADDAITAAKFDESTAFPTKSADTGATTLARAGGTGSTVLTDVTGQLASVQSDVATVDGVVDSIKLDIEADSQIDTTTTPWSKKVHKKGDAATVYFKKSLKTVAGVNVGSQNDIIGQEVHLA